MKEGRKISSEHFIFFVAPTESEGPRLGMTVSKQVGKAVLRNRLRRLIREVFRLEVRGKAVRPFDMVVLVKARRQSKQGPQKGSGPGLKSFLTYEKVKAEVLSALARAGVV